MLANEMSFDNLLNLRINLGDFPTKEVVFMTQEQTPSLEQTLERTDFGHFINENKKIVLIIAGCIIAAVLGYSIFNYQSQKATQERLAELFEVSAKVDKLLAPPEDPTAKTNPNQISMEKLSEQKAQEALKLVDELPAHLAKLPAAVPMVLKVVNEIERAELGIDMIPTLEKYIKHFSPKERIYLFPALKLATLYENAGNTDAAISILEKLVAAGNKVMEAKIYLDLGRLYLQKDQSDKARANFEYITKNYANTEFSKLADLYLMEM